MPLYDWKEDDAFGVQIIDDEHRRIAELAAALEKAAARSDETAAVTIYLELADILEAHFADEEAIMERCLTPEELADHKPGHHNSHEQVRSVLAYGRAKIEDGGNLLAVLPQIPKRYFDEVGNQDRVLRELLKKHRAG